MSYIVNLDYLFGEQNINIESLMNLISQEMQIVIFFGPVGVYSKTRL